MHGPTTHLAVAKVAEDIRAARERQRLTVHSRQRPLVLASLLLSRRHDPVTHRRQLRSEA